MNGKWSLAVLFFGCGLMLSAEEKFLEFQPKTTTRVRENTEWSQSTSYNTPDRKTPRLLLIGDSICNQYRAGVQRKLKGSVNLSFWVSSKCVTDPDYFRELDLILGAAPYTVISFNNGLHSLTTNRQEWENSYRAVVRFIRSRQPQAKLFLTTITPIANQHKEVGSGTERDYWVGCPGGKITGH